MPSTQILIIEKVGTIKSLKLKEFVAEDLYKKAGFKSAEGFNLATTWNTVLNSDKKTYSISLYGKTSGRAGQENKYDFPPPVDSVLFFGNCVLVLNSNLAKDSSSVENLTADLWEKVYEQLFGGFEDIGLNDSEEESDDDEDDDIPRTKDGYAKDGFIVDDDTDSSEPDESDDTDVSETVDEPPTNIKVKKVRGSKVVACKTTKIAGAKEKSSSKKTVFEKIEPVIIPNITINFLDCSDELIEEEYV